MIPAVIIRRVAENLAQRRGLAWRRWRVPIHSAEEAFNPEIRGKSRVGCRRLCALLFPGRRFHRIATALQKYGNGRDTCLRHLGIYGYRAGFIRRYVTGQPAWNILKCWSNSVCCGTAKNS